MPTWSEIEFYIFQTFGVDGIAALLVLALVIILGLLWLTLPFAIFGTQPEIKKTRAAIEAQTKEFAKFNDNVERLLNQQEQRKGDTPAE